MHIWFHRVLLVALAVLVPAGDGPAGAAPGTVAAAHVGAGADRQHTAGAALPGPCRHGAEGMQLPVDSVVFDHFRPPATRYGAGNRGWEFGTTGGERVCSVGAGVVSFAGPVAGRGVVSIRHGNGLVSSVTGLESVDVSAGALVVGGAPIGVARPGMHLGFRLDGEYIDPASVFGLATHAVLVALPPR